MKGVFLILDQKVTALLNDQVNREMYSAYLYLDFSNYFKHVGLDGFANWYEVQAKEEMDHAMLFVKYLQNNNVAVELSAIAKPDVELKDTMTVLKAGLKHGEYVTELIAAPPRRSTTSAPPSSWTGSSRSRVRRRSTPMSWSPRWSSSALIPGASICWTMS